MKNILYSLMLLLGVALISCTKNCDNQPTACEDELPTGTVCQAYYTSWFYNVDNNKCEEQGYSGCSPIGFETQEECEACLCNK
ncbi:BPTI/Kunitz domain-containing protein [Brumimicrobium aurantiacum]|uniref:Proteinase inhibitor I4 serpin n=1 Tax=Brumimicrobium aurantiacum TaxID=1737063 RepID=A0A3E1F144_9FLAO|nr:BPTI/Kunitz domain-containing protein [Brumimicrobium aurantiacum]RFC55528.1 proteinase inhibitor I4 serpin [Brumimicrobium aurantiacum]